MKVIQFNQYEPDELLRCTSTTPTYGCPIKKGEVVKVVNHPEMATSMSIENLEGSRWTAHPKDFKPVMDEKTKKHWDANAPKTVALTIGYTLKISPSTKTVQVGCKTLSKEDVKNIKEAFAKL